MSLNVALSNALSGLHAAQVGLDVVSRNVASANVEGYSRKTVTLTSQVLNGEGRGVNVGEIERQVDEFLQRDLRMDIGRSEDTRVRDAILGRLDTTLGGSADRGALSNLVASLTDGFRLLASNPESTITQNQALRQATQFAQGVNMLATRFQELRTDVESQINAAVDSVNNALTNIERLNSEFARLASSGKSTADLEDERDSYLEVLSKQIDVNVLRKGDGTISLLTTTGRTLLGGQNNRLDFQAEATLSASMAYPDELQGVYLDGHDITSELQSGGLSALFALRDKILPQAQGQLDEVTSRLVADFTAHGLELFNDKLGATPTLRAVSTPAALGAKQFDIGAAPGGPAGGSVTMGTLLRFSNDPDSTYIVTSVSGSTIGIRPVNGGTGLQTALSGGETIEFLPPSNRIQVNPTIAATPYLIREGSVTLEGATLSGGGTLNGTALADTITTTGGTVNAGDGDNKIFANGGTATINCGKGSDTITVAAAGGNTTVDGGAGYNKVVLSGASSAYTISTTGSTTTISGGPSGTIVLTNVQDVQFSDKVVQLRDTSANGSVALSLVDMFENPVTFPNSAMLGISQSYASYINGYLSFHASQRSNAADDLERQSSITDSVRTRLKNASGVNVDTELSLMTQLQNAYSSNARVIQVARDMFDELMRIGG